MLANCKNKKCGKIFSKNRPHQNYCCEKCGRVVFAKTGNDKLKNVKFLALKISKGLLSKASVEVKMNKAEKKKLNSCLFKIYSGDYCNI